MLASKGKPDFGRGTNMEWFGEKDVLVETIEVLKLECLWK